MDGSVIYWIFSGGPGSDYGWISDLLGIGIQVGTIAQPFVSILEDWFG